MRWLIWFGVGGLILAMASMPVKGARSIGIFLLPWFIITGLAVAYKAIRWLVGGTGRRHT